MGVPSCDIRLDADGGRELREGEDVWDPQFQKLEEHLGCSRIPRTIASMSVIAHANISHLSRADRSRQAEEAGMEFVDGQAVERPVSKESSRVGALILHYLQEHAIKTGQAEVYLCDLAYQCFPDDPDKFRMPDVSAIRVERLAGIEPDQGRMLIPPDLAVEVLSPGDLAYEIDTKVEEYLANAFPLVWVVDPNTRTLVIHRADGSVDKLHEHDEVTGESALPGFKRKVADFFAPTTKSQV
jgi:Uma2 family endonuclease